MGESSRPPSGTETITEMLRADVTELLEDPSLPDEVVANAYRDLARTQRLLGNTRAIFRQLRKTRHPIRSVLDIGCGQGALLEQIRITAAVIST